MKFPAVVYSLGRLRINHADNRPYATRPSYSVTVIDKDPDSVLPSEIAALPGIQFDRFFTADKMNHWAFTISF